MRNRKIVAMGMAAIMCMSMLTGCDFLPPKTPVELIQRSAKTMAELDNYRMTMDMDMGMTLVGSASGLEMDMDIPIELNMEMDRAGNYMAGDMEMSAAMNATVSYMGQSESMNEDMSESAELYMVMDDDGKSFVTYMNDGGTGWVHNKSDDDDGSFNISDLLNADYDEITPDRDAVMEKADGVYTVKMNFASMFTNGDFADVMDDAMGDTEIDWDEFADAIGDTSVVYKFDAKDYRLLSISTDEIEINDVDFMTGLSGTDMDGMSIEDMGLTMSLSVEFSKYGEIDEDDVEVPDDVVDAAVEEKPEASNDGDGDALPPIFGSGDDSTNTTEPVVTEPIETEPAVTEPVATEDNGGEQKPVVVDGVAFTYNGTVMDIPTDYQMFIDDGWYPVEDGQYGSFLCMEHAKYPYVTLYLNTNDGSGSEAYVKSHGGDGFNMEVDPAEACPPLTLSGVSFGDSLDDVKALLGEPSYTYASNDFYGTYESYEWEIEYDGFDCTLTVCLMNGEIVEMGISHWGLVE